MGIKMRLNKSDESVCKVCGNTRKTSLELFDIAFTDKHIITICDSCNEVLFNKTLKASCMIDSKLKSQDDLEVIRNRSEKSMKKHKSRK